MAQLHHQKILSCLGFPSRLPLKIFKTRLLERGFHTLIRLFRSPPQPTWDLTIHPPLGRSVPVGTRSLLQQMWDLPNPPPLGPASLLAHRLVSTPLRVSASSLAHCLVSSSNTICNDPSSPLADIVIFGLSLPGFLSKFLDRERFPHTYKKVFRSSPQPMRDLTSNLEEK